MTTVTAYNEKLFSERKPIDHREYHTKTKWLTYLPSIIFEVFRRNEPERVYQKNYGDKVLEIAMLKSQELNLEEMNILRKASKILRNQILEHRKTHLQDFTGSVQNTDDMPDELQMCVEWLLCGARDLKGRRDEQMETSARMYNTKNLVKLFGWKHTSKAFFRKSCIHLQAIFLGFGLRKGGRNKRLLNLLNRFGFTVSNEECIEWETSMVNKILNEMGENNGNIIPYGIEKDASPFFI